MKAFKLLKSTGATALLTSLLLSFYSSPTFAQESRQVSSFNNFIDDYYNHPEPARLKDYFLWCRDNGLITDRKRTGSMVGVFAGLLSQNPEFVPDFIELGKESDMPTIGKVSLTMSLWLCNTRQCRKELSKNPFSAPPSYFQETQEFQPKPLLEFVVDQPSSLDMLWGWFVTTGNKDAVKRILEVAANNEPNRGHMNASGTGKIDITAEAARWSLISQAAKHPIVMQVVKDCSRKDKSCEVLLREAESKKIKNNSK